VLVDRSEGPLAVVEKGAAYGLEGEAWQLAAPSPADFGARDDSAVAYDAARGVLLVAGGRLRGGNLTEELWLLEGGRSWTRLRPKGRGPLVTRGRAGWDGGRIRWVIVGDAGHGARDESPYTWEITEDAVRRFPHDGPHFYNGCLGSVPPRGARPPAVLAWTSDADSTIDAHKSKVWSYAGSGRWLPVALSTAPATDGKLVPGDGCAYDPARDAMVGIVCGHGKALASLPGAGWHLGGLELDTLSSDAPDVPEQALAEATTTSTPLEDLPVEVVVAFEMALDEGRGEPSEDLVAPELPLEERCTCGKPMDPLLVFARHAERLPLARHAALVVYACNHCDQSHDPHGGANVVRLFERSVAATRGGTLRYVRRLERENEDPGVTNKLGGRAAWLQGPEPQSCQVCRAPMRFVAQFAELADTWNFGGDGVAYVFVCPLEHEGRMLWQS
jgi:hypothetical protein